MLFFRRFPSVFCLSLLLLSGWLLAPAARAQDSTFTRLIRQNQFALTPQGSQFSGPGWAKIQEAIQKSQFVLVGEDHGMAEIPLFTAAVARELKPALYAIEVDPYVAANLTRFAAQPGQPTAYLRQYAGSLCFGTLAEEFELARTLRAQQARIIGLDQIFITNAAPTYRQLAGLVKGKAAQAYFAQRAAAYERQAHAALLEASPSFVMLKQTPAAIDSLLALTKTESPAAQQLAQDYAASYRIYLSGSHQDRVNLMKRNLLQELRPYQTAAGLAVPKMLFKFGAFHLARGASPIGFGEFYDLGNLMQNVADIQQQKSLHILIVGKQGAKVDGVGILLQNHPPTTYTEASYDEELPIKAFTDGLSGPAWGVFDLRPLRKALAQEKPQLPGRKLERIITGYDYLVVVPETTASHPM